jgi:flagellar protein FlbD
VIILTRLGGSEMAVNPDLIERADRTPDTVITMADGHKLVVAESLTELVTRVRHWRASVAAEAFQAVRGEQPQVDEDSARSLAELADEAGRHHFQSSMARVVRMPNREG